MSDDEEKITPYKFVLVGESSVGKSSLVLRFVRDDFLDASEATIGAAFLTKEIELKNKRKIKLNLWDTAGQEKFRSLTPMYFQKAAAAIVVFDITTKQTFEKLKYWVKELKTNSGNENIQIALCGNKIDLKDLRAVQKNEAENYAKQNGKKKNFYNDKKKDILYFETSAKENINVTEMFIALCERLKNSTSDEPEIYDKNRLEKLTDPSLVDKKKKKPCC